MKKLCEIQETCKEFTNGHKQRGHNMRMTVPCQKWIDMTCKMGRALYQWYEGHAEACSIKKKEIKK